MFRSIPSAMSGRGLIEVTPVEIREAGGIPRATVTKNAGARRSEKGFQTVLEKALTEKVHFSRHALDRIGETGVKFSETELADIEKAVEKLAEKGGRDSLLLMDDLALVVSIRNRTVVTVVDRARMSERVFTNIDSLMLIDKGSKS